MLRPPARRRRLAMLRPPARRWSRAGGPPADEAGSGAAIGMAVMFPMLILVIIAISLLSGSGHVDQALQSTADRAARTASLCCRLIGGPDGAAAGARAALAAAEDAAAANRIFCNNDFVGDSRSVYVALDGHTVAAVNGNDPAVFYDSDGNVTPDDETAVPLGGTVHVFLTCRVPPEVIGGFGFPGLDARRSVEGVAVIDPYRARP